MIGQTLFGIFMQVCIMGNINDQGVLNERKTISCIKSKIGEVRTALNEVERRIILKEKDLNENER